MKCWIARPDPIAWEKLTFVNSKDAEKTRKALFGDGSLAGALISQVHIGGANYTKQQAKKDANGKVIKDGQGNVVMETITVKQNSFPNIREVLRKLGFTQATPVQDHQNHFHIYLKPPAPAEIDGAKLTASSLSDNASAASAQLDSSSIEIQAEALLSYVQAGILPGETVMFAMDLSHSPLQDATVMLAQSIGSASDASTQNQLAVAVRPDFVIFDCQQVENEVDSDPSSAMRALDPAGAVRNMFQTERNSIDAASINVKLLQEPRHGKIRAETANTGYKFFAYDPEPGYLGKDEVVFLATLAGKIYKVVTTLQVVRIADERPDQTLCPEPQSVKVANSLNWDIKSYGTFVPKPASYTIRFGDLLDGAVGEVARESIAAQIALDVDAAGHGWYIDPTPLDNSDDYLPTSNPYVWQAKAGSDAAGKMDLLSVLLHEYGHALGLDHSSESGDFMAATLQPGQRRLPSAEELQLMSELVAQLKASDGGEQTPSTPSPLAPSVPLGALLLGRLALGRRNEDATEGSQALFAAHPTLQGGGLQN